MPVHYVDAYAGCNAYGSAEGSGHSGVCCVPPEVLLLSLGPAGGWVWVGWFIEVCLGAVACQLATVHAAACITFTLDCCRIGAPPAALNTTTTAREKSVYPNMALANYIQSTHHGVHMCDYAVEGHTFACCWTAFEPVMWSGRHCWHSR